MGKTKAGTTYAIIWLVLLAAMGVSGALYHRTSLAILHDMSCLFLGISLVSTLYFAIIVKQISLGRNRLGGPIETYLDGKALPAATLYLLASIGVFLLGAY